MISAVTICIRGWVVVVAITDVLVIDMLSNVSEVLNVKMFENDFLDCFFWVSMLFDVKVRLLLEKTVKKYEQSRYSFLYGEDRVSFLNRNAFIRIKCQPR